MMVSVMKPVEALIASPGPIRAVLYKPWTSRLCDALQRSVQPDVSLRNH